MKVRALATVVLPALFDSAGDPWPADLQSVPYKRGARPRHTIKEGEVLVTTWKNYRALARHFELLETVE